MEKKTPLGCWIEKIYIRFTFAENTLLAISHKSQEPSFREVMDSLVLVAYASLATSRTISEWLLTILNFTFDSQYLLCWYKQKRWFLSTVAAAQAADKQLKTMEISKVWPDTYNEGYIYTSISTWNHSQKSLAAAVTLSVKVSSKGTSLKWPQRLPQSVQYSHKLCDETGHPILSLLESQWKLRQQHDQNSPMERKSLRNKYLNQKK